MGTATLMSTQNADAIAVTGGTITGTTYTQPSGRSGTVTLIRHGARWNI